MEYHTISTTVKLYVHLFHVTMEIPVHSVENIPRYTADTVGRCDACYAHTHET